MALFAFLLRQRKAELLLEDVDVYDNADGRVRYHTDSLYICREDGRADS